MLWIYFFFTRGVLAGRSKESLYYRLHIDKENDSALNLLSNMLWTHFNALSMGLIMASYTPLASRPMASNIRTKAGGILIGNHKYKDDLFHYQEERKDKVYISPDSGLFWLASWYVLCTLPYYLSIFFCGLDWSARFAMKANWKLHPSQQISLWEIHFPKFNVSHQSLIFRCEIN